MCRHGQIYDADEKSEMSAASQVMICRLYYAIVIRDI